MKSQIQNRLKAEQRAAFTLIEVMVALVAFGIILAAINGVFWGALKLRNRTVESIDAALPLERAILFLRKDLGAIVPPGGTFFGQFSTTVNSTNTMLTQGAMNMDSRIGSSGPQFYTMSGQVDDSTSFSDVQLVSYSLVEATNRNSVGRDLCRNVTRNLLPSVQMEVDEQHILTGVDAIYFSYFDGTTWKESWTTNEVYKLPRAVKVEIAMAGEGRGRGTQKSVQVVVPLVEAGTNSTTAVAQ
jgi:type II secretion system protein J